MAPISPSASFLLPINHRGSFFEDAYFQDAREDFHNAVRDVLTRRDRGRPADKSRDPRARDLSCYRRLCQQDDFDQDSQALTITEDEENRKILLDVKEFHPDGDVKVYAVSDQELMVEGYYKNSTTGRVRSFSRTFMLPWYADLSCGFFSVDISSDGVLRIVTTKKDPNGRRIPLILDYQESNENESHQESYINTNNIRSNTKNIAFSRNGFEEAFDNKNGSVNNNEESVHCTSQHDTMREVPQNNKKERIIPVVFVKSETTKESNKSSQNSSFNQESTEFSSKKGSTQSQSQSQSQTSTKKISSSSTTSNNTRPIKTVITTTFDVKANTNKDISAKQQEIVIPVNIESKTSSQRTNSSDYTKQSQSQSQSQSQQQSHKNVPVSNGKNATNSSVNGKEQNKNLSSHNTEVKQKNPITVEKKKDKTNDADSSKSKTIKQKCFTILNKRSKSITSEKQNKDLTKDKKQTTQSKEFIIPLTIEGDSSDMKSVQKEDVRNVKIGAQDQKKKKNDNKPPINQNKKLSSPLPKKLNISNIFKSQEDLKKEMKSNITSDNTQHNRSESASNKPPPSPRNEKKHYRSSSIEEKLTLFTTRMSPVTERKSRKDFMDEIRGNGRGNRSRSSSIEELVSKFDKMSPKIERSVLNRKNSREENTELAEKISDLTNNFQKEVLERKESIIPIKIEPGDKENYNSASSQNENNENSNTREIKSVVKRRESIIPIQMECDEYDKKYYADGPKVTIIPLMVEANEKISKDLTSDNSKDLNVSNTENGNIYSSTASDNSITKENYVIASSTCSSNDSACDKNTKVNNDDFRVSSISSSSVIEDDNSLVSADEDSKKTSKGKTKKSSKTNAKRRQSIPGVQVSEDETGETTVLLAGRSSSVKGRKKKNVNNSKESLGDTDDHRNSPTSVEEKNSTISSDITVEASKKTKGTADSLTGFNKENISDSIGKEVSSKDLEVKDLTNYSEPNGNNLLLQKDPSNTNNLLNSMSNLQTSMLDSNHKDSSTKTVHDYSNLSEKRNESPRKGKVYGRTSVSQLVSKDSGSEGSGAGSAHQSRSMFKESRASVKLSYKITSDKSPTNESIDSIPNLNNSGVSENTNIETLTPDTEIISNDISFETSDKEISSEKNYRENNESKNSIEKSNKIMESRRSSVLPSSSDISKITLPKKNKKEKSETNQSSQNDIVESDKSMESRRSSVLLSSSDISKITLPKKNKKEKPEANQSSQNDMFESNKEEKAEKNTVNLKESRRASVLPNPSDLLKIKPPKKSVSEQNASSKKSVSSDNPENSKVNDTKVLENIPENTLKPEDINSPNNSATKLEPPPSPSLRRKTSFKKFKVFENKRTASPSPIRRPDSLIPPKTEQNIMNKIEEDSTSKKEDTNNRKEEKSIIKNEPSSTTKQSRINACVNIENKDMFFADPSLKDHRQLFMGGVRDALKRSGITPRSDKLRVYRELRIKGPTEDNQAICSAEDETSYKAVLDMTEFLEGEIKVKTMSSTEIIIEGISKPGNACTPFSHSLPFPDSIIMEAVEASLSEDGILAINAPKTNPDTEV